MIQSKSSVFLAKYASAVLITVPSLFPIVANGGTASCGWEAASINKSNPINCKVGSYSDCTIEAAFSDPARKIPVAIYSKGSNFQNWVDSTSDCETRYTKVTGYLCQWGAVLNKCTSIADPIGSQYSSEESRCKLVTKGNCQNNFSSPN